MRNQSFGCAYMATAALSSTTVIYRPYTETHTVCQTRPYTETHTVCQTVFPCWEHTFTKRKTAFIQINHSTSHLWELQRSYTIHFVSSLRYSRQYLNSINNEQTALSSNNNSYCIIMISKYSITVCRQRCLYF